MMSDMRTTLTLDPDVVRLVKDAMHQQRHSMKRVVNEALRRELAPPQAGGEPFRVTPHTSAIRPGTDLGGFNRIADEMEDDAVLRRVSDHT